MKLETDERIVVVGVTGSGKTTTAKKLSNILHLPHVELDSLYWNPGWKPTPEEEFRARVSAALCGQRWVTDGNYSMARPVIWGLATTILWLDYPLPVILWQLTCRTLARIHSKEELWNGNRETWRGAFFDKDSLFFFAIQSHRKHRETFPQAFRQPEFSHLNVIHLHSRSETAQWLARFSS